MQALQRTMVECTACRLAPCQHGAAFTRTQDLFGCPQKIDTSAVDDKHTFGGPITIVPPVTFDDWQEGGTFNYLVRLGGNEVFVSSTANFTSYAKEDFGPAEQQELAAVFAAAAKRGVRLMLSNSDVPFIRHLYQGFAIHTVSARRAINRDGAKRGAINEVLVCAGD